MSELAGQHGIVTGGGRGIGENIARELAAAGMEVAVSGRTAEQVESVAAAIGGRALVGDVSQRENVEGWLAELGAVDLLVANAGTGNAGEPPWEVDLDGCHVRRWTVMSGRLIRITLNEFASPRARVDAAVPACTTRAECPRML